MTGLVELSESSHSRLQRRWLGILVAGRYGIAGAGETFSCSYSLMVAPPTGLMVERSVARTCFAISYLFRESVHRGFDAGVRDLDEALSRETPEPHYRLALLSRLAHPGRLPPARRFDPALLLGDTPWALEPRTVRLRTRFTPTVDTVRPAYLFSRAARSPAAFSSPVDVLRGALDRLDPTG